MSVVLPPCPRLPYTLIGLVPVFGYMLSQANQHFLCTAVKRPQMLSILGAGLDNLAVHIKLELVARAIAGAHRARAAIAAQIIQFAFARSLFSKDGVQDPQFGLRQPRGM